VWFRRGTHALQLHDSLAASEQESVRHRIFWRSRLVSYGHLWQQGAGRSLAFRPSVASVFGVLPYKVFGPHGLTSHPSGRLRRRLIPALGIEGTQNGRMVTRTLWQRYGQ
jgi:hypothetical protein